MFKYFKTTKQKKKNNQKKNQALLPGTLSNRKVERTSRYLAILNKKIFHEQY